MTSQTGVELEQSNPGPPPRTSEAQRARLLHPALYTTGSVLFALDWSA